MYKRGESMNKNIFAILTVLFMVFVGLQFAEPAAAVKVVDHGTKYVWDSQDNTWMKITWKAYQYEKSGKINNNFIKVYRTVYIKDPKTKKYVLDAHETHIIAKVTKNSVKITLKNYGELGKGTTVYYDKTKLTAARYYWRIYKHVWIA